MPHPASGVGVGWGARTSTHLAVRDSAERCGVHISPTLHKGATASLSLSIPACGAAIATLASREARDGRRRDRGPGASKKHCLESQKRTRYPCLARRAGAWFPENSVRKTLVRAAARFKPKVCGRRLLFGHLLCLHSLAPSCSLQGCERVAKSCGSVMLQAGAIHTLEDCDVIVTS